MIVYLENGAFYAFLVLKIVSHVDHELVTYGYCYVHHCIVGVVLTVTNGLCSNLSQTETYYYYRNREIEKNNWFEYILKISSIFRMCRIDMCTLNWNTMNWCCSFVVLVFDVFPVLVRVISNASMDPSTLHHHDHRRPVQRAVQSLHVQDVVVV